MAGDKAAILQEITNEDGLTSEDDHDEKDDTFMYCNLFWGSLAWENQEMKHNKTSNFPVQKPNRVFFLRIQSLHQCGCASLVSTILYLAMSPKPWVLCLYLTWTRKLLGGDAGTRVENGGLG